MRTFRSKSLVFRASRNDPAWDPFLDLKPIGHRDETLSNSTGEAPPPEYEALPRATGSGQRPLTAQSGLDHRDGRMSFSRPRTATIFNRRTLLVRSLRRHDIDPHHSSLVDDDCIGVALGSPERAASSSSYTQSNRAGGRSRIESSIQSGEPMPKLNNDSGLQRRQSTWRAVGGLFGKKRQDRDSQAPPLPLASHIQPLAYEPKEPAKDPGLVDESYTPRFSAHFSRRRKSEVGHRPRKSLTLRRAPKTAHLEDDVPELPRNKVQPVDPPSLKEIPIPSYNMDRFSVMFAPVLRNHLGQHAGEHAQVEASPPARQRGDSPMALDTSSSIGHHHRSATAPSYLPSPTHDILPPPTRAAPPPPVPALEYEQLRFDSPSRPGSTLSRHSSSSTLRSSLSILSSDLEHYYLPSRYHLYSDGASTSSQSTPTFAVFSDTSLKPTMSHNSASEPSPNPATDPPTPTTIHPASPTRTTTLVLPSPPPSAYLSARPFPSPAVAPSPSPTHGYGYDAPHSPLVEVARSVTATATRPRMYSASPAPGGVGERAEDGGRGGVCLSDSRCGTPVVVQVVGAGRRVSQWGMVVGEDAL